MVKERSGISEQALGKLHGKPSSVGGKDETSGVQGSVSEGVGGDGAPPPETPGIVRIVKRFATKFIRPRYEENSGVPVAPPVGLHKAPSMFDILVEQRAQMRKEFSLYARSQGLETMEEAEDFDIPDDPVDPKTPWEDVYDIPLSEDVVRRAQVVVERYRKEKKGKSEVPAKPSGSSAGEPARTPQPAPTE